MKKIVNTALKSAIVPTLQVEIGRNHMIKLILEAAKHLQAAA